MQNLSDCPKNLELLNDLLAKHTAVEALSQSQREARQRGDDRRVQALGKELDLMFREKELAASRWQEHVREHGC